MVEILFLAHRIPWPADRGDKIRSYHYLRHLAQLAPVHVGAFADDARDMGFAAEMTPNFASVYIEPRGKPAWRAGRDALMSGRAVSVESFASDRMAAWVKEQIDRGRISHIFVFSGQMAQYIPGDFAGRVIMDFVDVDSAKFESYARRGNPLMRWVNRREARLLADFEMRAARRADVSLFVSKAEADLFHRRSGIESDKIIAAGNGIDTAHYDPRADFPRASGLPQGKLILFTGQMDYRPNIEAVEDFARGAMPAIRRAQPKAKFVIVGRNPPSRVRALAKLDGVIVTGAVDDVRGWLAATSVVTAPLRTARGVQNKLLEAMAMAKPVVASSAAAEGINAQDGVHFRIAANIGEEIAHCCALLADPDAAKQMGAAARRLVAQNYGWAGQLAPMADIMQIAPGLALTSATAAQ